MTQLTPFGAPATVGVRVGAFSVDAALVVIVSVAASLLASPVLGAAVAAEALLGLWILQARRGLTPGALLFGLRTARVEAPVVPGAGRAFVRGLLVVMGGVVLLAGAWVVVASAAFDTSGRRRSWADRAAGTVLLAVPRGKQAPDADEPRVLSEPTVQRTGASREPLRMDASAAALPLAPAWDAPIIAIEAPSVAGERPATVAPEPSAPAPTAPARTPGVGRAQLLVVFDTGQREQFDLPAAVNFGRAPVADQPNDVLISVDDPDRLISKTHLRLEHDGETAWVTDAGSTNGSELIDDDGTVHVLRPGSRTLLEEGTRVRLSERVFTLSRLIGGPV
ncbi:RDD family protein [Microbacterium testaceum]|uniref:RDD family protein n=1 Tax=Microbacterium testaceum TaxID=2033 RepID=UPI002AC3B351|nr:FHA domain-containing protein [Microbacterium testaceum]MDZ5146195.1 RDD family protein [Microbacterium testaceum]